MAIRYGNNKRALSVIVKVIIAGIGGIVVGLAIALLGHPRLAPLLGWNTTALIYTIWTWLTIWPMTEAVTKSHAVREDPSRAMSDIVVLVASIASLVAVGLILVESGNSKGATQMAEIALGFVSVVISWVTVHTIFTLRYAQLYYGDTEGGVDFNDKAAPSYKDFAYLAFTVGMTFQVSDTEITSKQIRHTILRQALISYMFGTVIVASTINLIAGLSK